MISTSNSNKHSATNPNQSVWVSASAGTGKTTLLVNRIIRLLLNNVSINKILCITYTKVGAKEMIERTLHQLSQYSVMPTNSLIQELTNLTGEHPSNNTVILAKSLFNKVLQHGHEIKIQTIHSFCQELLGRFPIEANISSSFNVIDEDSDNELKQQAINDILNNYISFNTQTYSYTYGQIADLVYTSKHNFTKAINQALGNTYYLQEIQNYIYNNNNPQQAISNFNNNILQQHQVQQGNYNLLQLQNKVLNYIVNNIQNIINLFIKHNITVTKLKNNTPIKLQQVLDYTTEIQAMLNSQSNINKDDYNAYVNEVVSLLYTRSQNIRNSVTKVQKKDDNDYNCIMQFFEEVEIYNNQVKNLTCANLNIIFNQLILEIYTQYNKLKQQHNSLTYEDLLICTKNLLSTHASWVMYKLDNFIDHLLIDEAQDTNPLQWEIVNNLIQGFTVDDNNKTIFVVGDIKQSIFSFQGADPHKFAQQKDYLHYKFKQANKPFVTLSSNQSFRSSGSVINLVNGVCKQVFSQNISYYAQENFNHTTQIDIADHVQLMPAVVNDNQASSGTVWYKSALQIINKIKYLHHTCGFNYKDIAVLFVKRKNNYLLEQLLLLSKLHNIPIALDRLEPDNEIFIKDIIALIQFVLQPQDNFNLACLLKSPIFNLTDNDIINLKPSKTVTLLQNLQNNANYASVYNVLSNFMQLSKQVSVYSFLFNVLYNQKYIANFSTRLSKTTQNQNTYSQTEEVAEYLLDLALEFENKNVSSLQYFLQYLLNYTKQLKSDNSTSNYINLLTIHGSKGMQFSAVIVADVYSGGKSNDNYVFTNALNTTSPMWLFNLGAKKNSNAIIQAQQHYKNQQLQEKMRLLYVAITRAKSHLYILPIIASKASSPEKQLDKLKDTTSANMFTPYIKQAFNSFNHSNYILSSNKTMVSNNTNSATENVTTNSWAFTQPVGVSVVNNLPNNIFGSVSSYINSVNYNLSYSNNSNNTNANQQLNPITQGLLLHQILDHTDNFANIKQKINYAQQALKNVDLPNNIYTNLFNSVVNILQHPSLQALNNPAYKFINEASIMGKITIKEQTKDISARIDKLLISHNEVIILDYKFAKQSTMYYSNYVKQIEIYKQLVAQLYPNHTVLAYLIFSIDASVIKL